MLNRFFSFLPLLLLFAIPAPAQSPSTEPLWLAPACMPKLYGLQDEKGDISLKAQFDFLYDQGNNAWIAIADGKFGVVNAKGEWIIKPAYEGLRQYNAGKAIAAKKVKQKEEYGSYRYSYSYARKDSVIRYGMIDESGIWLIDASYEYLEIGDDGSVLYTDEYGQYGFLNSDGTVLVKAQFDFATTMSGGAAVIGEKISRTADMYDYSGRQNDFKSGNYYVIDRSGSKLNKEPYDLIHEFSEGRAAFNKGGLWKKKKYTDEEKMIGGKWGFLDASGNQVVPAQYDYVYDYENGKAKVKLGERTFWIDKDGKETSPPTADVKTAFTVYCEPGSFGYVDPKGKWVIEPQFYAAHEFSEGLAAAMALRASDQDCEEPELESDYLYETDYIYGGRRLNLFGIGARRHYDDDETSTRSNKPLRRLFGYIDASGVMVIEAKYEIALPFKNNRAYVCFRGKWGIIDRQGNWVMSPVLDTPDHMSYMQAYYGGNEYNRYKPSYYDNSDEYGSYSNGNLNRSTDATPASDIYTFSEGFGAISYMGKFGFVDTTGKIVIAPVYDYVASFSQGFAAVRHGDLWGYVDKTGKEVIPPKYGYASSFTANGMAAVSTTAARSAIPKEEVDMVYEEGDAQYYGYIDKTGNWVIKPQFIEAGDFSEGLACASTDYRGKGYIDKSGKFIIVPKYDYAGNFENGYAYVRVRMYEAVYIDKMGKVSKVFTYQNPPFDKSKPLRLDANANGRYGFVNEKGTEVIPHMYRYAGEFVRVK